MDRQEQKNILEALFFITDNPISLEKIKNLIGAINVSLIRELAQ